MPLIRADRPRPSVRPVRGAAFVPLLVLAMATLLVPAGSAAPADLGVRTTVGLQSAPEAAGPGVRRARAALTSARHALARGSVDQSAPDATIALRDLALTLDTLPATEQAAARGLLARPTDGRADPDGHGYGPRAAPRSGCSAVACVHWASNPASPDSPDLTDASGNGVPDQVDLVLRTVTSVHRRLLAAGYRAPLGDGARGGSALVDVYLADIGDRGLYGYCATDGPAPANGVKARAAYCVLDDDYDTGQFPTNTPLENLQVTAAHEYFHAIQFAYDAAEDAWLMEATAAWVEDELFDDVDDNRHYLARSPLGQPGRPLDDAGRSGADGMRVYGGWIFFRWLSERFPAAEGGLATLVHDVWRAADSTKPPRDRYSLPALTRVLQRRGLSLPEALAGFAADNLDPAAVYEEGARYRAAPVVAALSVGRTPQHHGVRLDHLASASVRLTPAAGLDGTGWKLRVQLDLPPLATHPGAVVTTLAHDGTRARRPVPLDRTGAATISVPLEGVRRVDVTLVNASTRLTCRRGTRFSCAGAPRDEALDSTLVAVAVR